jgi:hypothetical protein
MRAVFGAAVVGALCVAQPLAAQEKAGVFVEALGGLAVPTFDVADDLSSGAALGGTIGIRFGNWVTMAEVDYGMHDAERFEGVDINTQHYIAKLGYSITGPRDYGWEVILNLGGGVVTFDVEDGDSHTYPAINAGAKLSYHFNPTFAVVLSPQGDIAFSDDEEIGTSNAWVWPLTAGVRVSF